ncbi:MAG: HEAT repeat domain-containing protein, partial [Candidatus Sulfotelmatobacter sp.]
FLTAACCAQTAANSSWAVLEAGLEQKSSTQRLGAIRVLGLIPDDPHSVELAEAALKDKNSSVRAAAATSLGQMHATGANAGLKGALNDKNLSVVMAAAHALCLLNDPACYDVYYEVYTGERKNNSGMIAQEMQILHNPKQLAQMGLSEGIGYVPFAGIPWEALQTIMKDRKSGTAARAALIAALATDPERRTGKLLVVTTQNKNWVLRVAALEGIAKRGDSALLEGIEPRLSDSRREVRFVAAATIIHLDDLAKAESATSTKIAQALPRISSAEIQAATTATEATK